MINKYLLIYLLLFICFNGICCNWNICIQNKTINYPNDTIKNIKQNKENEYIIMPNYPGGDKKLEKFIKKNLQYPKDAMEKGISGKVYVQFIVTKDGSITNIRIIRSLYPSLDTEALRIINKMPKWIPAKDNGKPVDRSVTYPIKFNNLEK